MDKQYIDDNDIGIKYLRKQLTPQETEEFEIYLMEHPEMVEALELDSLLDSSVASDVQNTTTNFVRATSERKFTNLAMSFGLGMVAMYLFSGGFENSSVNTIQDAY